MKTAAAGAEDRRGAAAFPPAGFLSEVQAGCVRISALILVPPLIADDTHRKSARAVTPEDEMARCDICGEAQRRSSVHIRVAGL